MKKNTTDLIDELKNKNCDIIDYLSSNNDSFVNVDIKGFWTDKIIKSGLSKSNIINKSDFSYCYFYDIISGRKIPVRDKIIRLTLTMGLGVDDCQEALRISGKSCLYARDKRDSIIIYALENGYTLYMLNELLNKQNEAPLK